MKIHIKNGRVIDPKNRVDARRDVFIAAGKIVAIGAEPNGFTANRAIEASGMIVCPGLVDRGGRELPIAAQFVGATLALPAQQSIALKRDAQGRLSLELVKG